jgi:hypothetical protein
LHLKALYSGQGSARPLCKAFSAAAAKLAVEPNHTRRVIPVAPGLGFAFIRKLQKKSR